MRLDRYKKCVRTFLNDNPDVQVVWGPEHYQIRFLSSADEVHFALTYGEEFM